MTMNYFITVDFFPFSSQKIKLTLTEFSNIKKYLKKVLTPNVFVLWHWKYFQELKKALSDPVNKTNFVVTK